VCCSVLQCVAVCCSVLQCVAVCCSVLQCATLCHVRVSSRQHLCVAARCSVCCSEGQCVLQRGAVCVAASCSVCCSVVQCVLQCVTMCCSVLDFLESDVGSKIKKFRDVRMSCRQHLCVALCCSVLHCVAVRYTVL